MHLKDNLPWILSKESGLKLEVPEPFQAEFSVNQRVEHEEEAAENEPPLCRDAADTPAT